MLKNPTINAVLVGVLSLAGCVLHEPPRNSRLLGDYTDFQKVDFHDETLVYRHPVTRVTDYDKFLIAPVTVYDTPQKKIRPEDRAPYDLLQEELRQRLIEITKKGYKVVDEIGPGVLKLEYTVVDIKPYVWLSKPDGTRYFRTDTLLKGSKFELDCKDALTDERIFAISTSYNGDEYRAAEDPELLTNIRGAFDNWAKFLSSLLVEAKQKRKDDAAADINSYRPPKAAYLPDKEDPSVLVYRHPRIRPLFYKMFFIAIPRIEGRKDMPKETRKELGIQLRQEAAKMLKNDVNLVNAPGPGVLTARTRIEESPEGYRFTLECIDPQQSELIFGMVKKFPPMELFDAYKKWNELLVDRLDEAKEASK